jgi:hypothetical protein
MSKTTILALLSTIIIMVLLIFVPIIAALILFGVTIFMIAHTIIDLIDFHFKHKNK